MAVAKSLIVAGVTVLLLLVAAASGMAVCWGDLDNDRDADGSDIAQMVADLGRTDCASNPPCRGDIHPIASPDDIVDGSDVMALAGDFGRADCAFHAPLNLFNIGNSIGEAEAAYEDIGEMHHETVWSTGYEAGDIVTSLNEHFESADPSGFFENNFDRDATFNHAFSGAVMADFISQAGQIVDLFEQAPEATPSGKAGMITILLGNNDVCADSLSEMTDLTDFENQFKAGLDILAASAATKNAYIHVSGIPAIYWLWEATRSNGWCNFIWTWFYTPCKVLLYNWDNDCAGGDSGDSHLNPDEIDPGDGPNCIRRKEFHQAIEDDYNRIIEDALMEYKADGRLPNAYYVDIFDIQFGAGEVSAGDCFHPNVEGIKILSDRQWCRSPWSPDDDPICLVQ